MLQKAFCVKNSFLYKRLFNKKAYYAPFYKM